MNGKADEEEEEEEEAEDEEDAYFPAKITAGTSLAAVGLSDSGKVLLRKVGNDRYTTDPTGSWVGAGATREGGAPAPLAWVAIGVGGACNSVVWGIDATEHAAWYYVEMALSECGRKVAKAKEKRAAAGQEEDEEEAEEEEEAKETMARALPQGGGKWQKLLLAKPGSATAGGSAGGGGRAIAGAGDNKQEDGKEEEEVGLGKLEGISVSPDGLVVALDATGLAHVRVGVSPDVPAGTSWVKVGSHGKAAKADIPMAAVVSAERVSRHTKADDKAARANAVAELEKGGALLRASRAKSKALQDATVACTDLPASQSCKDLKMKAGLTPLRVPIA
jgi:hypothetical protein